MPHTLIRTYFGTEWHTDDSIPELDRPVVALIELDITNPNENDVMLVDAKVRYVKGGNPEYLWDIETEDGIQSHLIAGGWSVIVWRYK